MLSAADTKEKRADERRVHEMLAPFIERYLSHYRPVLARLDNKVSALWLSANDGTPITANYVSDLINAVTLSTVGGAVSPHLFRTAVASTAAIYGGENPHLASALLHHTNPSVTNDHYNRATSLTAAESLRQIVRQYDQAASTKGKTVTATSRSFHGAYSGRLGVKTSRLSTGSSPSTSPQWGTFEGMTSSPPGPMSWISCPI